MIKCSLNRSHPTSSLKPAVFSPFHHPSRVQLEPELVMGKELKRLLVPFQGISDLCKVPWDWKTQVAELSCESHDSPLSHPGPQTSISLCVGGMRWKLIKAAFKRLSEFAKKGMFWVETRTQFYSQSVSSSFLNTHRLSETTATRLEQVRNFKKAIKHDFLSPQRSISYGSYINSECPKFYSKDFTLIRQNKNMPLPSLLQVYPNKLYEDFIS